MNETLVNRLSVAAAILLLFLTGIVDAKLMFIVSAIVLIFGFLFFTGRMKAKIAVSALIGFIVAMLITRFFFK